MQIESLHAIELLDSRGMPTVGCRLQLADGAVGISVGPSGASTGKHESCELRDGDEQRYFGKEFNEQLHIMVLQSYSG